MKGIVFRLFEDFVTEAHGADLWERVLAETELETKEPFVGPGTYPDEDLLALVGTASRVLGVPVPDAVRSFGRFSLAHLVGAVPGLTDGYHDPRELLLALDGTVHSEVRKLWRDARPPRFETESPSPELLRLHYESARGLCPLVAGLLDGAIEHYGVPFEHTHTHCVHRGDARCTFELSFRAVEVAA